MLVDDSLTGREPDAGTFVAASWVQTAERRKDLVMVLGVNADTVVGDRNVPVAALAE